VPGSDSRHFTVYVVNCPPGLAPATAMAVTA
jgi:hypothetical protein